MFVPVHTRLLTLKHYRVMEIPKDLDAFRADFNKLIKTLEKKYKCSIKLHGIKSSEVSFNSKISVKIDDLVDGKTVERYDFERLAEIMGFEKSDYKRRVRMNSGIFELYGFNSRAPRNSCLIRRLSDRGLFACHESVIKRNFLPLIKSL